MSEDIAEKTQIGWSITKEVERPENITLDNCLRGQEIESIYNHLDNGKTVFIYGNDGFGKSTLIEELAAVQRSKGGNIDLFMASHARLSTPENATRLVDEIDYIQTKPNTILLFDSADYLWEDSGDLRVYPQRARFFRALLDSGIPTVVTFHKDEPVGKKVSFAAKNAIFMPEINRLRSQGKLAEISLCPFYPIDKAKGFFSSLGFDPKVAELFADRLETRQHVTIKNYLLFENVLPSGWNETWKTRRDLINRWSKEGRWEKVNAEVKLWAEQAYRRKLESDAYTH